LTGIVIFIIALAAAGIIFTAMKNKGGNKVSWTQFYAKGAEAGFSNANIRLLKKLAQYSGIKHPATLFWSQKQLDACIKNFIYDIKQKKTDFLSENQEFLAKLYEFRKKMEMERPVYRNGITSSRNIDELQTVQVVEAEAGTFKSKIISNTPGCINIERPDSSVLPVNFSWKHRIIMLYFWRKNDATYCMETRVIDEVFNNSPPLLKISHSDKLFRTQNRKSPRVKSRRSATLYNAGDGDAQAKPAVTPGINCRLEDISDSGCCVSLEENVPIGMRVIIRFVIDETPISIGGVVRGVNHDAEKNISFLHIESDIIPTNIKNKIFSVLFNTLTDEGGINLYDDNHGRRENIQDLPFLGGAAASAEIAANGNSSGHTDGKPVKFPKTEPKT
jgi:c-di-GMP-binding flagellar brake protein YcgR